MMQEIKQPSSAHKHAFAEVIESSLHTFTAQCWQWDKTPSFGSLVTIVTAKKTLFGLVTQIQTGSMDPTRYPFPYQKTEEELLVEQPQIFEFLKTTFSCVVMGYYEKGHIYYLLAPEPPKIHAFVTPITHELCQHYFSSDQYLQVLFGLSNQLFNLDELLLALLKQLQEKELLSEHKLTAFIEKYSLLTGNDYRRLKLLLHRVEGMVRS
jgi:hypothetical protein